MTHTKRCCFNAPLYLTSPSLAECDSTTGTDNSSNMYWKGCNNRPTLPIGTIILMVVSSTPLPLLSVGLIAKKALWPPVSICKLKSREISFVFA